MGLVPVCCVPCANAACSVKVVAAAAPARSPAFWIKGRRSRSVLIFALLVCCPPKSFESSWRHGSGLISIPSKRIAATRRHRLIDHEREAVIGSVQAGLLDGAATGRPRVGRARDFEVGGRRSNRHFV